MIAAGTTAADVVIAALLGAEELAQDHRHRGCALVAQWAIGRA